MDIQIKSGVVTNTDHQLQHNMIILMEGRTWICVFQSHRPKVTNPFARGGCLFLRKRTGRPCRVEAHLSTTRRRRSSANSYKIIPDAFKCCATSPDGGRGGCQACSHKKRFPFTLPSRRTPSTPIKFHIPRRSSRPV